MSDVFNTTGGFGQLRNRIGALAAQRMVYIPKPFPVRIRAKRSAPSPAPRQVDAAVPPRRDFRQS